jgi:hypothetical protein
LTDAEFTEAEGKHDMSVPKTITELYAWICTEEDGSEGLCAQSMLIEGYETLVPFIGADMERVQKLRPFAATIAHETGKPIRLVRFSIVGTMETAL